MNKINTLYNDENNKNVIRIIYNPSKNGPTKIFGENFVFKNSKKCKIKANIVYTN